MEHLEGVGKEKPFHISICSYIVDIVCQVFYIGEKTLVKDECYFYYLTRKKDYLHFFFIIADMHY